MAAIDGPHRREHPADEPGVLSGIRRRAIEFVHDPIGAISRRVEETSYDYPPAVVYTADVAMIISGAASVAVRHGYFPSPLPFVALALLILCYPVVFLLDVEPHPVFLAGSAMIAQALFLIQPVAPDCSPLVLTVMAGEVAAIAPRRLSVAVTVAGLAELLIFAALGKLDSGLPMYLVGVVLGWMVGLMLQFQRRFLYQERENQEIRAARAADEERRRIAREVHDVIAHSLSITMLHLTAARHALQTDRDVDEAVDALSDAERLGRQAMADIRHTVGLLDRRPSAVTPEPSLGDIGDLVADFVGAGLPVGYHLTGDSESISAGTGLALYRISQESLANIAKHAPGADADLTITITGTQVTVTVVNTVVDALSARRGRGVTTGMGISGMRQRAALLGGTLVAGPHDDGWRVRARIPLAAPNRIAASTELPRRMMRDALNAVTRRVQEGT